MSRMKPTVYIETTIASFYWETRNDPESVAMKDWTREWWSGPRLLCDCWTSAATLEELDSGEHPEKELKLDLLENVLLLEINDEISEIAQVYVDNYLMPRDVAGDALHVAVASYYKMDYLLTWNCAHLANARKKQHLRRINARLRLETPEIITPLELLGEQHA
jgi:predicted nucleic acid-binding protein